MSVKTSLLNKPYFLSVFACAAFSLFASASQAEEVLQIAAKDAETKGCRLISSISADSGYGKKIDWKGEAKNKALAQAKSLDASAVVWERYLSVGAFNGTIEGKAYNCKELSTKLAAENNPENNGLVRK